MQQPKLIDDSTKRPAGIRKAGCSDHTKQGEYMTPKQEKTAG